MNGVRQMSYGWLNKYGSDIVNGFIKLGLQGIGEPQLASMLKAGEIDLYLMGALKQRGDKWLIRGFELIHAGEVETLEGDGGLPDIVTEQKVNSAGFNIP